MTDRDFAADNHQALCQYVDWSKGIQQIKTQWGEFMKDHYLYSVNLLYCSKFQRKHSAFHCQECKYWKENTKEKDTINVWMQRERDAYYHPNIFESLYKGDYYND